MDYEGMFSSYQSRLPDFSRVAEERVAVSIEAARNGHCAVHELSESGRLSLPLSLSLPLLGLLADSAGHDDAAQRQTHCEQAGPLG